MKNISLKQNFCSSKLRLEFQALKSDLSFTKAQNKRLLSDGKHNKKMMETYSYDAELLQIL